MSTEHLASPSRQHQVFTNLVRTLAVALVGLSSLAIGTTFVAADANENLSSPTQPLLSARGYHTCAIINDAARCWGSNQQGQLGDQSTTDASAPVQVDGLTSDITAVSTGLHHTCAIVNGAANCWGNNGFGQLGIQSFASYPAPAPVFGLTSGVTAISAGSYHSCAIVNGGVKCWGDNVHGQLGNGSLSTSNAPVDVSGLGSGVTAISAGSYHTCAIVNGTLKCWGMNTFGQLGNQSNADSSIPVQVDGLTSGVTAISAGGSQSCAIVAGAAKCWGANNFGQLGNGTASDANVPADVTGLGSNVSAISAGFFHSCAIVDDEAKCWGLNLYGQLGNQSTSNSSTAVQVFGLTNGVSAISAGVEHSCAIVVESLKCWGSNGGGQLGVQSPVISTVPLDVTGLLNAFPTTTTSTTTTSTTTTSTTTPNASSTTFPSGSQPSNTVGVLPAGSECNESVAIIARDAGATAAFVENGDVGPLFDTQGVPVESVAYSADGRHVFLARADGVLEERDAASGQVMRSIALPAVGQSLVSSPNGETLVVSTDSDSVGLVFVDLPSFTVSSNLSLAHNGQNLTPGAMTIDGDGGRIYALAGWGGTTWVVVFVDLATRTIINVTPGGTSQRAIAVTADGRYVVTNHFFTGANSEIRVIDTTTASVVHNIDMGFQHQLTDIVTAADPRLAYVADWTSDTIKVIDVVTGVVNRSISVPSTGSTRLAISHDGTRIFRTLSAAQFTQVAWQTIDVVSGSIVAQGLTNDVAGPIQEYTSLALCPRTVTAVNPTTTNPASGGTLLPTTGSSDRGSIAALWLVMIGVGALTIVTRRRRLHD